MNTETIDLTHQVRELHYELNAWHSLIFTSAVKAFDADTDLPYDHEINHELVLGLKPYSQTLIDLFKRDNFDKAAVLVLKEWNKDKLSKSYLEKVVATQLYRNDH